MKAVLEHFFHKHSLLVLLSLIKQKQDYKTSNEATEDIGRLLLSKQHNTIASISNNKAHSSLFIAIFSHCGQLDEIFKWCPRDRWNIKKVAQIPKRCEPQIFGHKGFEKIFATTWQPWLR